MTLILSILGGLIVALLIAFGVISMLEKIRNLAGKNEDRS